MIEYIKTQTPDGEPLLIEVAPAAKPGAGFGRQPVPTDVSSESSKDAYNQILSTIRACAHGIIDTLQNLDTPPTAASVDFAIKVDAETGAMVAKSGGDAQFKISLSWRQPEPERRQPDEEAEDAEESQEKEAEAEEEA
ncbi:MAG: hypothetical protein D6784_17795 [Chloroflexi bacterium]|nr:MAG: hypothetical protein D6784_17795 [Chloroflexota bacterium]